MVMSGGMSGCMCRGCRRVKDGDEHVSDLECVLVWFTSIIITCFLPQANADVWQTHSSSGIGLQNPGMLSLALGVTLVAGFSPVSCRAVDWP